MSFLSLPTFVGSRVLRRAAVLVLATVAASPTPAQETRATVRGVATDSIRGGPLSGAFIELLPGGRQIATGSDGRFELSGVPPAAGYRLRIMHALLDTLGISLTTPSFTVKAGTANEIHVATPSVATFLRQLCPAAQLARGPAAIVGFVRDPDTGQPIDGVSISLVYDESPVSQVKMPVTRSARPNAAGQFSICGLPAPLSGKVQLTQHGVPSGDIPIAIAADFPLAIRAMGMGVRAGEALDSTKAIRIMAGDATVRGRVVTAAGTPIGEARVQVNGSRSVALTSTRGEFQLDSVPVGTQMISVRKLGYSVAEQSVEISRYDSTRVTILMADFVPRLSPVVTVSQRTRDLEETGFARRRAQGLGFFLEGEQIDRGPPTLGEALRTIPGIRVGYDASNRTAQKAMIMASRDPRACLRYVVDGVYWQEVGGDIEKFVRPQEIEALEMYTPATVPGEFAAASRGRCSVLVLWTRHKIRRAPPA